MIEKALWEEDTAKGMAPVAEAAAKPTSKNWRRRSKTVELQAVQIANGANELLGEVSASKITGEEERYSHIDLVDFKANVEGSEAAFEAVEPLLSKNGPEAGQGNRSRLRRGLRGAEALRNAATGSSATTELTKADTRKLAQSIDTLAEKLTSGAGGDRRRRTELGTRCPAGGSCRGEACGRPTGSASSLPAVPPVRREVRDS